MKRSEAVKNITESLVEHPLLDDLNQEDLFELSNDILKIVERFGMLPPIKATWCYGSNEIKLDAYTGKWEQE